MTQKTTQQVMNKLDDGIGDDGSLNVVPSGDGVNTDGSLRTKVFVPNMVDYGKIFETGSGTKVENGVTFAADSLIDGADTHSAANGGTAITLRDGTTRLRIRTDATGAVMLWVGGTPVTGSQRPLVAGGVWEEIEYDFSSNNEQADDANVIYLSYGADLGASKYVEIVTYAEVVS